MSSPAPPPLYHPTLILHGGAGNLARRNLPPSLYTRYRHSLLAYLTSTRNVLVSSGASALDAAVHAVSLMEDDELFNCGRGSVFNEAGENVMEASIMVSSVRGDVNDLPDGRVGGKGEWRKRGAGVMEIRGTRHPIQLAREVLLNYEEEDGEGGMGSMHCQLVGEEVERWGWEKRGLERKEKEWFWTKRRWEEHLRGLKKSRAYPHPSTEGKEADEDVDVESDWRGLSQGTVGAVCLDQWGNLAVATSTGGLTNKKKGRIGDTPTLGAGFWAESWDEEGEAEEEEEKDGMLRDSVSCRAESVSDSSWFSDITVFTTALNGLAALTKTAIKDCLPTPVSTHPPTNLFPISILQHPSPPPPYSESNRHAYSSPYSYNYNYNNKPLPSISPPSYSSSSSSSSSPRPPPSKPSHHPHPRRRRALALSGTGNGDSFLRTTAARTTAAMCRFSSSSSPPFSSPSPFLSVSLAQAVTAVAGPGGELQKSAGGRWEKTGEGQGGIIGIEVCTRMSGFTTGAECAGCGGGKGVRGEEKKKRRGKVVADFNCGGMWRAWWDDERDGGRVRVFRDEEEEEEDGYYDTDYGYDYDGDCDGEREGGSVYPC